VLRIKFYAVFVQKAFELIHKAELFMMFFLMTNIFSNGGQMAAAHGKGRIAFLPGKRRIKFFHHPSRGCFFQFAHDIGQAMGCPKAGQNMDMILNSTNYLGGCIKAFQRAAEIFVQFRAPGSLDLRAAFFRAEHDMVMQAEKGGAHFTFRGLVAPLQGALFCRMFPGVSLRLTPGYWLAPLRGARRKNPQCVYNETRDFWVSQRFAGNMSGVEVKRK